MGGGGEAVKLGVRRQDRPLFGRRGAEENVAEERVGACRGISPCLDSVFDASGDPPGLMEDEGVVLEGEFI